MARATHHGEGVLRPDWHAPPHVAAATTTRAGYGVSRGPWARFNLARHVGDDPAAVTANRRALADLLALPAEPVWLHQVHGTRVADLDAHAPAPGAANAPPPEGDAAVTRVRGRVCVLLTADCLPVLLCDAAGTVVAAAHAGWRGLAGGVLEQTLRAMACPPWQVRVWLGPCLSQAAFEVGPEVRDAFLQGHATAATAFRPGRGDRWQADLQGLARLRLLAAGVPDDAIQALRACTSGEAQRFFSYRRDGVTGRMATLIWLR